MPFKPLIRGNLHSSIIREDILTAQLSTVSLLTLLPSQPKFTLLDPKTLTFSMELLKLVHKFDIKIGANLNKVETHNYIELSVKFKSGQEY